jgi:hypothetical protein
VGFTASTSNERRNKVDESMLRKWFPSTAVENTEEVVRGEGYDILVWQYPDGKWSGTVQFPRMPSDAANVLSHGIGQSPASSKGDLLKAAHADGKRGYECLSGPSPVAKGWERSGEESRDFLLGRKYQG